MNNNNHIQTAVILAAGTGSRLQPLTQQAPKCLTPVGNHTILQQQLNHLRSHSIHRLVMVIGYMGDHIKHYMADQAPDFSVEWIDNPQYASTNNIYSLWLARSAITEPFLLLESDLVFDGEQLTEMLELDRMAISPRQNWMNGTHVEIDADNSVIRFIQPPEDIPTDCYKTVNIYSFSQTSWQRALQSIHKMVKAGQLDAYYETAFARLVAKGQLKLHAVKFDPDRWYEIDTLDDLQAAKQRVNSMKAAVQAGHRG
ncbi:sugar phosphate nucleotidyltransferase [Hahella ganghwensis]|uniref:phosphocholine cytidylyltransferase family protein n=1 Tax=Hahella ganghwensis TaxID=286420 RepID=UPI00037CCF8B|nr:phosphocholine cytidylyltransferase family protein [Hahella ganghwensis]